MLLFPKIRADGILHASVINAIECVNPFIELEFIGCFIDHLGTFILAKVMTKSILLAGVILMTLVTSSVEGDGAGSQ